MIPTYGYSEEVLLEQPAIALCAELGWQTANCAHETYGLGGSLGRGTCAEVARASRCQAPAASGPRRGCSRGLLARILLCYSGKCMPQRPDGVCPVSVARRTAR